MTQNMTTNNMDTDGDVEMSSGVASYKPKDAGKRDGCQSASMASDGKASLSTLKTGHLATRASLERSIIEVLAHDGFSSATPQAMDSFTSLVETCQYRTERHHQTPSKLTWTNRYRVNS